MPKCMAVLGDSCPTGVGASVSECLVGPTVAAPVRVNATPTSVSSDTTSLQRRHHTDGHVLHQQNGDTSCSNADDLMFPQVFRIGHTGGGSMAWGGFGVEKPGITLRRSG